MVGGVCPQATPELAGRRPGAAMLTIYVKTLNRAYALDRCLRSVDVAFGPDRPVVALDDGLDPAHVERLAALHPRVRFRRAAHADAKRRLLESAKREGRQHWPPEFDPLRFWVDTIAAETDPFILVLEEDTWIDRRFALAPLLDRAAADELLLVKMSVGGNERWIPEAEIYARHRIGGQQLRHYAPQVESFRERYKVSAVGPGLFRTDYWRHCHATGSSWTDEPAILNRGIRYLQSLQREGKPTNFAWLAPGLVRHTATSTSRLDGGGTIFPADFDANRYTTILNRLWLDGSFDPMVGFPGDVPVGAIVSLLAEHLPPEEVEAWRRWQRAYVEAYRSIDIELG
jgi:hypothetical protein